MKQGRKLATTKKDLAERLGTATTTREGSGKLLQDLIELKARYENFSLYPELTEAARLWDGKSEPDPIAQAMGLTDSENERLAAEAGMSREEWEEAQRVAEAKREAEKATGSLFGDGGSFSLAEAKERGLFDKDGVLEAENATVFAAGTSFSIIAYHVSPNDFDEFKTKFIGAGLGAQMLGWGIYFTDDVQMNKVYVRKVAKKTGKSPVNYRVELDMEQEDLLTLDGELSPEMRERLRPLYEEMLAKLPEEAKRPDVEYWQEEYAFRTGFDFQIFLERCLEREGKGEKEVSLALLKHGVKGSKLKLDNGASYIVAFDENDIKITAKGYEATGYEWQDVEEDGGHGSFSIAGERVPREEAVRIAREFGALSESEGVRVEAPEVYAEDGKEARAFAREVYRKLQEETAGGELLEMPDGRRAKVSRRGLSEVQHHSADRRVLAALCALRDLCRQSIYINSAANTQPDKKGKEGIVRFHYYIAKGNFVGAAAADERAQDEAYVNIVLSEYENGDLFYDLDATNVEDVNKNEGASATLPGARLPRAGEQEGEAPYAGRIQQTKQFVNYVNKKIKEEGAGSHGSFSVIGPHARTWDKHADRAFAGRDDGKMRAEIDASQARLKGAWTAPRLEQEDIYALLGTLAEGNEQVEKLIKFRDAWDRYLELIRNEAHLTEKEKAELRGMKNWVPDTRNELTELADRVLKELGYDTTITKRSANRVEALRSAALMADVKTLKKYNKYRKDNGRKLGDILDYPELFDAYPELREMKVDGDEAQANGSFSPSTRTISLNKSLFADPDKLRSTLLHEIQHAIQGIEGFAGGGSPGKVAEARREVRTAIVKRNTLQDERDRFEALPEEMKDMPLVYSNLGKAEKAYEESEKTKDALDAELDKKRNAGKEPSDEEIERLTEAINRADGCSRVVSYCRDGSGGIKTARDRLTELNDSISQLEDRLREVNMWNNLSDFDLYQRIPGEIESRNVQERRDWTAEQRQATPFNDTLEYPGEAVNFGSFSVAEAKEKKLFDENGIMHAANGVLIDGTSFSYVAMHASPHWIQGKFRMDKINSGEGNQAFGVGMYFTESEGVNDHYLNQFKKVDYWRHWVVNGERVYEHELRQIVPGFSHFLIPDILDKGFLEAVRKRVSFYRDREELEKSLIAKYENTAKDPEELENFERLIAKRYKTERTRKKKRAERAKELEDKRRGAEIDLKNTQDALKEAEKVLAWAEAGNTVEWRESIEDPAYNYRVEIDAEENELFYWDDKMTDESNAGALERLRNSPVEEVRELAEAIGANTGEKFYWQLADKMREKHGLGHSRADDAQAARYASEALLASGIKGHKYADGFTREKPRSEWLYNSVVYDMGAIKITHVARGNRDWKPYAPREEEPGGASMSVIGPRAKTFSKYVDKAFLGRDDGKMRAEIDASQARLKGAWKRFSADDLLKLLDEIATPEEKKKLAELRKVVDRYKPLVHKSGLTEKEAEELQSLRKRAIAARKGLEGLAEGRANILVSHLFPLLLTVLLTTKSMSFIIEIVLDFPLAASL